MKKLFALIITAALILSFAACGGSGKNDPSEPDAKDTDAQVSQSEAVTEDAAGEPSAEQPDDDALIEAEKAKLTGKWTMNGVEEISRVFNEDGTCKFKISLIARDGYHDATYKLLDGGSIEIKGENLTIENATYSLDGDVLEIKSDTLNAKFNRQK